MAKNTRSLNDTVAVAAIPAFGPENKHESQSKSIRKIDNGYVVSTSSTKDGRYESREEFTTNPNSAEIEANPMRKAVDYMKREGTL